MSIKSCEGKRLNNFVKADPHLCEQKFWENIHETIRRSEAEKAISLNEKHQKDDSDINQSTTLIEVVQRGDVSSAKSLLDSGANVNQQSSDGKTPLSYCAIACDMSMMNLLLEYNPTLFAVDNKGNSALDYAIMRRHFSLAKRLLTRNLYKTPDHHFEASQQALFVSAQHRNAEVIEHLLNHSRALQYDVFNMKRELRQISLTSVSSYGKSKPCILHLKASVRTKKNIQKSWSPLHSKLIKPIQSHYEQIKRHFNKEERRSCVTPLSSSSMHEQSKQCTSLLEKRPNVNQRNKMGWTPLHIAAKQGNRCALLFFIKFGAGIEDRTLDGKTPLLIAACEGKMCSMQALLERGANMYECDMEGVDILTLTAMKGHISCFWFLMVQQKYKVNSRNQFGLCPLDNAARMGTIEVVDHLIKAGARFVEMNKRGKRPLDYAIQALNIPVVKHLLNLRCRVSLTTWALVSRNEGCTILLTIHFLKLGKVLARNGMQENALEAFKTASRHLKKPCERHLDIKDGIFDLQASLYLEMSKSARLLKNFKLAEEAFVKSMSLRRF